MDFFADVGAEWGANWKGILIRQSMTGFPEIKSLCAKVIPRIWPNARFNQNKICGAGRPARRSNWLTSMRRPTIGRTLGSRSPGSASRS